MSVDTYTCMVILTKLANLPLPMDVQLYEFYHNYLLDNSNMNLKTAGTYNYQITSGKQVPLCYANLKDKSVYLATQTIIGYTQ